MLTMGCAARPPTPAGPAILVERLPPGTRLCVRRHPFIADMVDCLTVEEFRALVRGLQRVSLEAGS